MFTAVQGGPTHLDEVRTYSKSVQSVQIVLFQISTYFSENCTLRILIFEWRKNPDGNAELIFACS